MKAIAFLNPRWPALRFPAPGPASSSVSNDACRRSTPLLDFAKFRPERRGVEARLVDLSTSRCLGSGFGVVTAIDTLAHVPDVAETSATTE